MNLRKLLSLLFVMTFNLSASAQSLRPPGEQVLPLEGKNFHEKRAQGAWKLLPLIVKACRALPACQMTASEIKILDQVISNLSAYTPTSLQFESEAQNPGRFTSDQNEAHRLAVTGNNPQAPIFLNSDRIGSLSWAQLVGILGHEVVHHTGVTDDSQRVPDQIGAKLGRYFELNSIQSSLEEYGHPEIRAIYFGVGVPETTGYFQIFPVPTDPVHAKSLVMDRQNVYDIDTFESYSPYHCYAVPGSALVNEQVSDPKIHLSRWFPGDREVSVSLNVLIRSVCLIVAHAPDADMKASRAVGQTTLQLVLENPSVPNWQQSPLKIRADFIRVNFRPSANLENPEISNFAKVEKIISAPATVKAGENYQLQLLVRTKSSDATLACDSYFDGEAWHSLDMTSFVPFRNFDGCEAVRQEPDLYLVTLKLNVPKNAVPGFYGVETLGLKNSGTRDFVTAAFPKRVVFQVLNATSMPLPKIIGFQFVGVGNSKLISDRTYDFEVRIENAESIFSSFISGRFNERSGHHLDFTEEVAHSQKSMFRLESYRREGNVLVARYKALIPGASQDADIKSIQLFTFSYQTQNWGEAYLDLRQNPAVFEVAP